MSDLHDRVADEMAAHLDGDASGHDMHHAWRVHRLGTRIAREEGADERVVGAAALVHDLHRVRGDGFTHPEETLSEVRDILAEADAPEGIVDPVCHCVAVHEEYGFEDDPANAETVEAEVLQDADNLDAIGAVGVARAFQFGGAHDNLMWAPDRPLPGDEDAYEKDAGIDDDAPGSTYHHFHSKLLRLHENMNTEAGREIAAERHAFLEEFAERFESEWYGEA
ncbi:HD domain-containing protein [Halobacterium litoreum]|uniref:HD domain-containing protein n=1 Tax=Halobacterium litoreum TaxID=2039234 RepID=A0ABD5NEZ5_9EURY|nr:HD domain-containing protein [Halobacterium litoreum]UHH13190.1 HD domain-containing protein [Halobacterium litoreum]